MSDPNPGGYSLGSIFKKEPAAIVAAVQSILAVAVALGLVDWSAEVVAGVIAAVGIVLGLVYVRPTVSTEATVQRRENVAYHDSVNVGASDNRGGR